MKTYIGTKIIQAEPQAKNYGPVEGHGQPGYKVVYADGYASWSPAAAFEAAYRECSAMSFGLALEMLKAGKRVARAVWNGKGMWLVLIHPGNAMHTSAAGKFDMQPCIGMKTADGNMQPGWLASQADILAEDWTVVA